MTFQPDPIEGGQPTEAQHLVLGTRQDAALQGGYLTHAFFWMFAGLLLSGAVGVLVRLSPQVLQLALDNLMLVIIAQFALVLVISFGIRRISASVALGLFFVYAASIGFTVIALSLAVYPSASVIGAFLSASAMFGGAALYGYTTHRSLANLRGFLFMAVIGLVGAMLVNVFLGSSTLDFVISIAGVVLFTVLTAYHVQRIANGDLVVSTGSGEKAAVIGALLLYLDFVNLFLFLLRLFGGRR